MPWRLPLLLLALASCERAIPDPAVRERAHAQITQRLQPVARFAEKDGVATAYRLVYPEVALGLEEWSWREAEVFAQRSGAETGTTTSITSYSLDPLMLAPQVRATYANDAWGLELGCAEGRRCIEAERRTAIVENGRSVAPQVRGLRLSEHSWYFDDSEDRDAAIVAVRQAIGAPPR